MNANSCNPQGPGGQSEDGKPAAHLPSNKCPICGKAFLKPSKLKRHERMHIEENSETHATSTDHILTSNDIISPTTSPFFYNQIKLWENNKK